LRSVLLIFGREFGCFMPFLTCARVGSGSVTRGGVPVGRISSIIWRFHEPLGGGVELGLRCKDVGEGMGDGRESDEFRFARLIFKREFGCFMRFNLPMCREGFCYSRGITSGSHIVNHLVIWGTLFEALVGIRV